MLLFGETKLRADTGTMCGTKKEEKKKNEVHVKSSFGLVRSSYLWQKNVTDIYFEYYYYYYLHSSPTLTKLHVHVQYTDTSTIYESNILSKCVDVVVQV